MNDCFPVPELGIAFITMRTAFAVPTVERCATVSGALYVGAACRLVSCRASYYGFAIFRKHKIGINVFCVTPCKVCSDKIYILACCFLAELITVISTICNKGSVCGSFFFSFKVFIKKVRVAVDVLFELVVCYDGAVFSDILGYVCYIATVLFPRLSRYVASGSAGLCMMEAFMPPSSFVLNRRLPSSFRIVCSLITRTRSW